MSRYTPSFSAIALLVLAAVAPRDLEVRGHLHDEDIEALERSASNESTSVSELLSPSESSQITAPLTLEKALTVFKSFDKDRDGFIDEEELLKVMKSLGRNNATPEQAHKLILKADKTGDGVLDFKEYLMLMSPALAKQVGHGHWQHSTSLESPDEQLPAGGSSDDLQDSDGRAELHSPSKTGTDDDSVVDSTSDVSGAHAHDESLDEEAEKNRESAATKIQAVQRGRMARKEAEKKRAEKKEADANKVGIDDHAGEGESTDGVGDKLSESGKKLCEVLPGLKLVRSDSEKYIMTFQPCHVLPGSSLMYINACWKKVGSPGQMCMQSRLPVEQIEVESPGGAFSVEVDTNHVGQTRFVTGVLTPTGLADGKVLVERKMVGRSEAENASNSGSWEFHVQEEK